MARKRFKKEERKAFTPGTEVEWLNGTHWLPGLVDGPIKVEEGGWECIPVKNSRTTRTVSAGLLVHPGAGHVRLPSERPQSLEMQDNA